MLGVIYWKWKTKEYTCQISDLKVITSTREFLEQYLTERQNSYFQSGCCEGVDSIFIIKRPYILPGY